MNAEQKPDEPLAEESETTAEAPPKPRRSRAEVACWRAGFLTIGSFFFCYLAFPFAIVPERLWLWFLAPLQKWVEFQQAVLPAKVWQSWMPFVLGLGYVFSFWLIVVVAFT